MFRLDLNGTVAAAIAKYTGHEVLWVEGCPDPNVPGVFAFRASLRRSYGDTVRLEFLTRVPLRKITEDDLEEVEFANWPPTVGRPSVSSFNGPRVV